MTVVLTYPAGGGVGRGGGGFLNNILDLVKEKSRFYSDQYMSDFEKFKEELPSKEKICSLTDRKISDKEYEHVPNIWNKFEM